MLIASLVRYTARIVTGYSYRSSFFLYPIGGFIVTKKMLDMFKRPTGEFELLLPTLYFLVCYRLHCLLNSTLSPK
jgi:hypothetical protein